MRELIKTYKVLADESRLRVLNLLLERECCVCEVMQTLEISQSKASRILNALYDVGFLKVRRDGLWSLYSIDRDSMSPHLRDIMEATRSACADNEQMASDRQRLKTAKRLGPGCARGARAARLATSPRRT
ncbi:MAG: ArsR/SmtB family transcription factor [Dehalococcoidia bacterium]